VSQITLHQGDCLEYLKTLEPGSVDAVVTDPPYNVGFAYNSTYDNRHDYAEWCAAWFADLKRVCNGPIAISVGQSNLSLWATLAPPTWWLAWWKPAAMGRCVVGFNNWEPIALYGKPTRATCDVIRAIITPDKSLEGHPCPKPYEWAAKQIEMLTQRGATILDPFMGSGTTGVACVRTGRNFIGCEIDPGYFAIAQRRIADEQAKSSVLETAL
jgi:site-specific DNA-methyltransferase (adenine-specific)